MLKPAKNTFFGTLNEWNKMNEIKINESTDNRKFSKIIKPFFTDKCKASNNIILTEKKWNSQWQQKFFQRL